MQSLSTVPITLIFCSCSLVIFPHPVTPCGKLALLSCFTAYSVKKESEKPIKYLCCQRTEKIVKNKSDNCTHYSWSGWNSPEKLCLKIKKIKIKIQEEIEIIQISQMNIEKSAGILRKHATICSPARSTRYSVLLLLL